GPLRRHLRRARPRVGRVPAAQGLAPPRRGGPHALGRGGLRPRPRRRQCARPRPAATGPGAPGP
ncbi:MAG: hypothetical protein AVDCRST_MAG36-1328, partial [uncultured Nocardioidaceae bacterium]